MSLKETLKNIKLHESTISMALGAVLIVIIGSLAINFLAKRNGETIPPIEITDEESLPTTHIIQEGETLSSIAEKYYGIKDWSEIARENNINDPNKIIVGQELSIPKIEEKIATVTPLPTGSINPKAASGSQTIHVVLKSESLWKIAEKYFDSGYNWVDIAKENKISNPNLITEGQNLIIPNVEKKTPTLATSFTTNTILSKGPISGATYSVEKGDSLWEIAVRAYGDGYKWVSIAKENNLSHPGLIHSGNELRLPR